MPLIIDSFTVTFLADELDALLAGRMARSVYISDDRVLSISFARSGARRGVLRFLHAPGFALLCVDEQTEDESELTHLPRFEGPLEGASVISVEQADLDRIVLMRLASTDGSETRLYFELNPSLPNLFLTDGEDLIQAVLLKAGTRTRSRRLDVGRKYTPPPTSCRIQPSEVDERYLSALSWLQDDRVLAQSVIGVSPFFSREVAQRATEYGSLVKAYDELMSAYRRRAFEPHTFSAGKPATRGPLTVGISWFRPRQKDVSNVIGAPTLNAAALGTLRNVTTSRAFDKRKALAAKTVERDLRKWRRIEAETQDARREAAAAAEFRKYGELLMANLDIIRKGQTEVALADLHSGGGNKVNIKLAPHLSPQDNAGMYFKKARKSARRAELAHQKLAAARRRLLTLEAMSRELESLADPVRLTEIEERVLFSVAAGEDRPPEDEKALRLGIKPRRYVIVDGWTVLVGRSARENDILTHRYASPSDFWFHARQAQGAHVVLRRERKKAQPTKRAIEEAAAIAAYYSRARTSANVPVSYTEKRYVKRVRKGPPGTAAMLREKVIFVNPRLPRT